MRIGIVEMKIHLPFLIALCKIFNYEDNEIYLYVGPKINEEMKKVLKEDYYSYNWIVSEEDEPTFSFLLKVKRSIKQNKIDLLFLNSVDINLSSLYYIYLLVNNTSNKIITIHSINFWFKQYRSNSLKNIVRKLLSSIILRQVDSLNVFGENLKQYLVENFKYQGKVYTLPFSVYEPDVIYYKDNNLISFVIPGVVEETKKNYHIVLDVFEKIFSQHDNIELVLLGRFRGSNNVLERCQYLESKGYNIKYYKSYIEQVEYEKTMSQSDVIIGPIYKNVNIADAIETYGMTKATGVTYAMVKYSKPGIIPKYIQCPEELKSSTIQYTDKQHLEELIHELMSNKLFLERLTEEAINNSDIFSVETARSSFIKEFKPMI